MTEGNNEDLDKKEEDIFCDDEVCEAIDGLNAFCEAVPEGDARKKCTNVMELLKTGELDVKKARAKLLEDIGEDLYLEGAKGLREWMFPEGEVEPVPEVEEVSEPEIIEMPLADEPDLESMALANLAKKAVEVEPEAEKAELEAAAVEDEDEELAAAALGEPEIAPITVELSTEPPISIEIPPVEPVPELDIEELNESVPIMPSEPQAPTEESPQPSLPESEELEASSEDLSKEHKEAHSDD